MQLTHKVSANHIQGILRLKNNNQAIGPLRPARNNDAETIQRISKNIFQGMTSSRQLLLTTGFGLHTSLDVPVRLPALAIPGFQIMEKMKEAGLEVPTYVIYQATDFIAETNGLSASESHACANRMQSYLQGYAERFHPEIADNVLYKFGCEYPQNVQEAVTTTIHDIRSAISEIPQLGEALSQIHGYEAKHSNRANHYDDYAAANVIYSGATDTYPFQNYLSEDIHTIFPIGGNAEKPFFTLTAHFAEKFGTRKIIPMLTSIGSRPTYYPYQELNDPVSIDEYTKILRKPLKDGPLRTDIQAMMADGAMPDQLAAIYPER